MYKFEIILNNNDLFCVEGSIEQDKCNNQLEIVLKAADHQLCNYLWENSFQVQHIYGYLENKKIILKSYYIDRIHNNNIYIHVVTALFYEGDEENFDTIQSDFEKIDNVNIHYNFLNHIENYEDLKAKNICFKKINSDLYINFKFNPTDKIKNVNSIHQKISNIYQLITSKKLNINDLYLESKSGKYYIFNSNFNYSDKDNKIYRYENMICKQFVHLFNHLFNIEDRLSLFIDDFIANINHHDLLENQIIILVAMIECFDSRDMLVKEKKSSKEKEHAREKIKKLLDILPSNIKEEILRGFENSELFYLRKGNDSAENVLLSMIINSRVYRVHGTERKNYVVKDLKLSVLLTQWVEFIIQIFLLFKLNLNNGDLLCIVRDKVQKINAIRVIESW